MKDLAFDHWDDLLLMVVQENDLQLGKWGYQDHDPFYWMVFLTEEVGELAAEIAMSTGTGRTRRTRPLQRRPSR